MRSPNQLQRFAANGTPGTAVALTGTPVAVDVDAAGNVAVVTTGPNELRSFGPNANPRFTVALPAAPAAVAIDPSGNPAVTLPAAGDLRRYSVNNGAQLCRVQLLHQPGAFDVNPGNGDFQVASEPPPNPTPQLTVLSPDTALAGGSTFTLTVDASNVVVFNPSPGGGTSTSLVFTIGQARAAVSTFGTGCAGASGVPLLAAAGVPRLGTTYRLDLTSARAQTPAVFFVGISRTTWLGLTLPMSLAAFGAPTCTLLASGELPFAAGTSATGTASLPIAVPNDATLIDRRLYHQVLVSDPAANALNLVFTRGLDALIGDL
jgi:hypothetical protein